MSSTWKCDGPQCQTPSSWPYTRGIMRVSPTHDELLHFCSWECIYRHAAFKREASGE